MAERALKLVDTQTGELFDDTCPDCERRADELAGLERDLRGWAVRYAQLKREKDQQARDHELWPQAVRLFDEWRERCNHPNSDWTPDRFWAVEPFLTRHDYEVCLLAVKGAAFDPRVKRRRNGSLERFDGWDLIFRNADKFESFVNRAPRERRDAPPEV